MWIRSGDIRDQSRKLSEIAQNFGRFLALLNVWWRAFQKVYPVYHSCLAARRQKKFNEDTPTSPEVTELPGVTLNFRPNSKFSRLKFFWGTVDPLGVCASKPWSIWSACKNSRGRPLRAEIVSRKKVDYGLYTLGSITFSFSTPSFFPVTWEGLSLINYFSDFRYVDPFRRYSRSESNVVRNRAEFFFALPNFWGRAFQKLYPVYHSCLTARRLKKFREDTPSSSEARKLLSLTRRILGQILIFYE